MLAPAGERSGEPLKSGRQGRFRTLKNAEIAISLGAPSATAEGLRGVLF